MIKKEALKLTQEWVRICDKPEEFFSRYPGI